MIIIMFILGMLLMDWIIYRVNNNLDLRVEIEKRDYYIKILTTWLDMRQHGITIGDYMKKRGYNRVIIYGLSYIGERLYTELESEGFRVVGIIDSNQYVLADCRLYSPNDDLPEADLMIITSEMTYNEVKEKMSKKVSYPIIGFSGLIGCLYGRNF